MRALCDLWHHGFHIDKTGHDTLHFGVLASGTRAIGLALLAAFQFRLFGWLDTLGLSIDDTFDVVVGGLNHTLPRLLLLLIQVL